MYHAYSLLLEKSREYLFPSLHSQLDVGGTLDELILTFDNLHYMQTNKHAIFETNSENICL